MKKIRQKSVWTIVLILILLVSYAYAQGEVEKEVVQVNVVKVAPLTQEQYNEMATYFARNRNDEIDPTLRLERQVNINEINAFERLNPSNPSSFFNLNDPEDVTALQNINRAHQAFGADAPSTDKFIARTDGTVDQEITSHTFTNPFAMDNKYYIDDLTGHIKENKIGYDPPASDEINNIISDVLKEAQTTNPDIPQVEKIVSSLPAGFQEGSANPSVIETALDIFLGTSVAEAAEIEEPTADVAVTEYTLTGEMEIKPAYGAPAEEEPAEQILEEEIPAQPIYSYTDESGVQHTEINNIDYSLVAGEWYKSTDLDSSVTELDVLAQLTGTVQPEDLKKQVYALPTGEYQTISTDTEGYTVTGVLNAQGEKITSEYTDDKGVKHVASYEQGRLTSIREVNPDRSYVERLHDEQGNLVSINSYDKYGDSEGRVEMVRIKGKLVSIQRFDKDDKLIGETVIVGVDEDGNLIDDKGNIVDPQTGKTRAPPPSYAEVWEATGALDLFLDKWPGYVAWQQKSDAFFAQYLSIEGWTSEICNRWIDRTDLPSSIALGREGLPGAHIEGERSLIYEDDESGNIAREFLYKITFTVNPRYILKQDKFKLKFGIYVKDSAGNMHPVRITQGVDGSHKFEIRKDTGEIRYAGSNMIVRQNANDYTEACIDFSESSSDLEAVFKSYLDSNKLCNSLMYTLEPKQIQDMLPSEEYMKWGHAITFNWGGGDEDSGNAQNKEGRSNDESVPTGSNTGEASTGNGL